VIKNATTRTPAGGCSTNVDINADVPYCDQHNDGALLTFDPSPRIFFRSHQFLREFCRANNAALLTSWRKDFSSLLSLVSTGCLAPLGMKARIEPWGCGLQYTVKETVFIGQAPSVEPPGAGIASAAPRFVQSDPAQSRNTPARFQSLDSGGPASLPPRRLMSMWPSAGPTVKRNWRESSGRNRSTSSFTKTLEDAPNCEADVTATLYFWKGAANVRVWIYGR
jgi:hypothetical protein